MTKSNLMKQAWKFANGIAKKLGVGTASEYISEGMRRAWKLFGSKLITKKVIKTPYVQTAPLRGRMTEKQEAMIFSLLRRKASTNPIAQAFGISSTRQAISKQQASDLINELLAV